MKEFDKVIGYSSVKNELIQIADVLKNREVYARLGVKPPRGLMLTGVPGVGKSLMALSLIEASGLPSFVCRKDKPNGEFINEIKAIFEKAVENAPSIVFLDDMDKFTNGDREHPDAEEYVTVQSCIDESKSKDIFVLATTNSLGCLPDSLLRSGRFDRTIYVNTPTLADAEQIIGYYLTGKSASSELDAKSIAKIMSNRSCADLETVINEAGIFAGFDRAEKITMEHFMRAAMHTVFDVPYSEISNSDFFAENPEGLRKIAYHEAGHVIVHETLDPESITLVSAYSNERHSGGFTSFSHADISDPYYKSRIKIIGSLAGIAAIEQKFGTYDTGAASDLERAFDDTSDLIKAYGVSGFNLYGMYDISENLKARQEQTAATELEKYYRKAKEIIGLNIEFLDAIAEAVIEKKFLSAKDIKDIRARFKIVKIDI